MNSFCIFKKYFSISFSMFSVSIYFKYFSLFSNSFLYLTNSCGFKILLISSIFSIFSSLSFVIICDNILLLNIFFSNGKNSFLFSYSFCNKSLLFNVSSICLISSANFFFSLVCICTNS